MKLKSLASEQLRRFWQSRAGKPALIFFLLWLAIPDPGLWPGLSFSAAFTDKNGQLLRLTLAADERFRLRTPLGQISPELVRATLLYEDRYFYWHFGFNPLALGRSFWSSYVSQARRMGGSTITMQLARLRYRLNTTSLSGKLRQLWLALQLERHYSKEEILEAYFSLAPYGQNIEGAGAASLIYFGKPPGRLNLKEALSLAVIPQNPAANLPVANLFGQNQNQKLEQASLKLYQRWLTVQPRDLSRQALLAEPLPVKSRQDLPLLAPHLTDLLLKANNSGYVQTSLDLRLQKQVESLVGDYIQTASGRGLHNAAVMIVDYQSMELASLLGSADYFNAAIQGQVNGALAFRSPGSTLKPFLYGLALDQGLIHAGTVLKDAPAGFGAYSPENNDRQFQGPLSAQDALNYSRNLPAVYLATRLKNPDLYGFLQQARVQNLKSREHYGQALVLGGNEMSMFDLVRLYAALANLGQWQEIKLQAAQVIASPQALMSPEAAFIVREMLSQHGRPGEELRQWSLQQNQVAWKTGTSYGFKDAWAVAIAGKYIVAVWVGNFSGEGSPSFTGLSAAAPLLFRLVDLLSLQARLVFPPAPALKVEQVEVCTASGGLPGPFCPAKSLVWFIPGKSPIAPDTVYRQVTIDLRSGLRTCAFSQSVATRQQVYEFWPSDIQEIFRQNGMARKIAPPFSPECQLASEGSPPQISSPRKNVSYSITTEMRKKQKDKIPFSAISEADVETLYWFVDTGYAGQAQRGEVFLWPARPGLHTVTVADDRGKSDSMQLEVIFDR